MSTPMFESKTDLQNELNVVKRFAALADYDYSKLKQTGLDYLLYDKNGKGKCFLEIKCFNYPHTQYPTEIVNIRKWEKMKTFDFLAPSFFVCRYSDDVIMYIRCSEIKGELDFIKRKNPRPNAANDSEWCIRIPKNKMKRLKEKQ